MIEIVRDMLGITTQLVTTAPRRPRTERLIEQVKMVGGTAYLAGQGGKAYMGDDPEDGSPRKGWSSSGPITRHTTGDSVVTLLMDEDDPMEIVLKTTPRRRRSPGADRWDQADASASCS